MHEETFRDQSRYLKKVLGQSENYAIQIVHYIKSNCRLNCYQDAQDTYRG